MYLVGDGPPSIAAAHTVDYVEEDAVEELCDSGAWSRVKPCLIERSHVTVGLGRGEHRLEFSSRRRVEYLTPYVVHKCYCA